MTFKFLAFALACCTAPLAQAASQPIIIIPGYLANLGKDRPNLLRYLSEEGFEKKDIFYVDYNTTDQLDVAEAYVAKSIRSALVHYPAGTKAKIIAWSMGHFVTFYTLMHENLDASVESVVSVAGIGHGTENNSLCKLSLCGKTLTRLMPYENDFVTQFYQTYGARVEAIEKCAMFSPDDSLADPFDSGKFDNDIADVSIPGIHHLKKFADRRYFNTILRSCWKMLPKFPDQST